MKTSELIGAALDWAVEKCTQLAGFDPDMGAFTPDSVNEYVEIDNLYGPKWRGPEYGTDWAYGGPIIEREGIAVMVDGYAGWCAWLSDGAYRTEENSMYGDTPLIAAMRCYVASKLGDEVDVPEELV